MRTCRQLTELEVTNVKPRNVKEILVHVQLEAMSLSLRPTVCIVQCSSYTNNTVVHNYSGYGSSFE